MHFHFQTTLPLVLSVVSVHALSRVQSRQSTSTVVCPDFMDSIPVSALEPLNTQLDAEGDTPCCVNNQAGATTKCASGSSASLYLKPSNGTTPNGANLCIGSAELANYVADWMDPSFGGKCMFSNNTQIVIPQQVIWQVPELTAYATGNGVTP